jgi:hypothetical protein
MKEHEPEGTQVDWARGRGREREMKKAGQSCPPEIVLDECCYTFADFWFAGLASDVFHVDYIAVL